MSKQSRPWADVRPYARQPGPEKHYDLSPPGFEERVNAFVGRGTFRMPTDGAPGSIQILPGEHLDAAAIAYARVERGDFGPDVLMAVALGSDANRDKCVHGLARVMAELTQSKDDRPMLYAAMCAWDHLVHGIAHPTPASMPAIAWETLLKLAVSTLDGERQSALAAARRARR